MKTRPDFKVRNVLGWHTAGTTAGSAIMPQVEQTPNFSADALGYAERQGVRPLELTSQLESLTHDPHNFTPLDSDIFGLRIAPLTAPRGGDEYVLAIEHLNGRAKLIVLVAILNSSLEEIRSSAWDPLTKRKINVAVARIISMLRQSELSADQKAVQTG
jgi:hypothetical protein